MSAPHTSVILHGATWPGAEAMAASNTSLADALAVPIEWLEARERADSARGLGAVVAEAAARATGSRLIFVEAGAVPRLPDLTAAVNDLELAGTLLLSTSEPASEDSSDLTTRLVRAHADGAANWAHHRHLLRPRLLVLSRDVYRRVGGIDARFWSSAAFLDLAARAEGQHVAVVRRLVHVVDEAIDAWPATGATRTFLAIRESLVAGWKSADADTLGTAVAEIAVRAIGDAWRAAAVPPQALTFGGRWGDRALGDRLRGAGAVSRGGPIWPADEAGTIVPLLALDAFVEDLVAGVPRTAPLPRDTSDEAAGHRVHAVDAVAHQPRGSGRDRPARDPAPLVSVIVVNWNGREHLDACFSSLLASDYPARRLQLICVDNGSTDGSRDLLRDGFPAVRVVELPDNRGFTGGNAAGVAVADGTVLVFLNNDMRVEATAVSRLVAALDATHPCAAARVLSWDGKYIDFVRGTINFEARGFQEHFGELNRPELAAAAQTFFPNGGAFAVTREAYEAAGGFDPAFFAYYDDIDLGWGLRLAGFDIRVAGEAVVYHRHGATSGTQPAGQKKFLMERNAIWTVLKRYGDYALGRVLGAMLLLTVRRIVDETSVDRTSAVIRSLAPFSRRCRGTTEIGPWRTGEVDAGDTTPGQPPVRRLPVETLAGIGEGLESLGTLAAQRTAIQRARAIPDSDLLPTFGRPLEYISSVTSYKAAQDALAAGLDFPAVFRGKKRVLVITHEPLRVNLSGPGVRALEIARTLSHLATVTVATPFPPEIRDDRCSLAPYSYDDPGALRRLAEQADVLIVQGFTLSRFPVLLSLDLPLVVDLYCPFTLEHLEMATNRPGVAEELAASEARGQGQGRAAVEIDAADVLGVQDHQLRLGDFFICASERQRDFWLGALQAAGRVNPRTYTRDPTLRSLIDVVPFGLPEGAPPASVEPRSRVLKGVRPGIAAGDRVLLWAGSILDWQDPQTLVRAVAAIAAERTDVKLFFMGTRHPNPQVPPMRAVEESLTLARDLGVLDTHVFFNDWVPYDDRWRYLADADLGLSTHREHLETRLSFRTRMLDYLWAGLPIVCTDGDVFASLVREHGLGRVVPPDDPAALAAAIVALLDDEDERNGCRRRIADVAETFRWSRVVAPLARFVAAPTFAADRAVVFGATRRRLAASYGLTKWMKRTALSLGVSEVGIEQVKRLPPVRALMAIRNRLALARARRAARS